VTCAGAAQANPRDDKKRVQVEIARAAALVEGATQRAQGAAARLAAAAAVLPAAQQRVGETRGEVAAAQAIAATARRRAVAAQAALTAAGLRHAAAERVVEQARGRTTALITASYKGSALAALNVVIEGRSPMDVMNRVGYVGQLLDTQRGAIEELTGTRRAAKRLEDIAGAAKSAVDDARLAAEQALSRARAAQVAAEAAVARVAALAAERRAALTVARQERAASLARYAEAKAEAARIEAELRAWEARQVTGRQGGLRAGGRLLMPVSGWKSSDFGMRFDPYFGVWQLHAGTDFAAGAGAPIVAAADGRVIRAGWNGGYGNFTCLGHGRSNGRGVSTCYAHQSRILVGAGQLVRRGQVIGRVGTTGASTGYHLHFEVRLNGRPNQPLSWLPPCLC
jgi:murein DD-endopeptidase MepM/ murein hydrolase activator NlpD